MGITGHIDNAPTTSSKDGEKEAGEEEMAEMVDAECSLFLGWEWREEEEEEEETTRG